MKEGVEAEVIGIIIKCLNIQSRPNIIICDKQKNGRWIAEEETLRDAISPSGGLESPAAITTIT